VNVLVAARDIRVRRALSGLLESAGYRVEGTTLAVGQEPDLDADAPADVVVLELDRGHDSRDLTVIERLSRRGRSVIVVCSGPRRRTAVLAVGAKAYLDKDDAGFADRLAEAVAAVTGPPDHPLLQT
jgi:DNA-binding NtrC family response regulator